MSCVIKIEGWMSGRPCNAAGKYIKSVDVQKAAITEMWLIVTSDINQAYRWASKADAVQTYREILKAYPRRPDGKPHRPLMALSITIEQLLNGDE